MNYADVQTNFSAILNRRDITPTQLTTFMQFAIQRIQREVRIPSMERYVATVMDGSANLPVPGDYLEMINLFTDDQVNQTKLVRTDLQTAIRYSQYPGIPKFYYRQGTYFLIGPTPPQGTTVYMTYYGDATSLVNPTDTNWLTLVAPDLLVYAALSYAADYFLDERAATFEQRYQSIVSQLMTMATQDELENASISPMDGAHASYDYCY